MDRDAIKARALDYVSREGDAEFRSEVEALLENRGLEGARGPFLP